jgi:hypothetical protein
MTFTWNAQNIVLYLILLAFVLIIVEIISIKVTYKPMFEWWNNNGGSSYEKNFNIFSVMASEKSILFYWFSSLTGTLNNQINREQITFLVNKIFPLTVTPGISEITQFVLPRHMTESIQFQRGDADLWFNNWIDKNNYDDQSLLTYNTITEPTPNDKGLYIYSVTDANKIPSTKTNKIGVYPGPNDTTNWKYLFVQWGAKTWEKEKDTTLLVPSLPPDEVKEWMNCELHPDNFLARYGILPNSPMIVSFIYDSYNDARTGLKLDPNSFKNLVGGSTPGGWVGYLNGLSSSNMSYDEYVNYLYTTFAVEVDIPKPNAPVSSRCDTGTNVLNSIGVGLGPIGIGAMFGAPGLIVGGLFGLGLSIFSGVNTANKCKS